MTFHRVALVSCGASKRDVPSPARRLYTGSLFIAARGDVERRHLTWWVMSAEHGLVHPDATLAPYELHLRDVADRPAWGRAVVAELARVCPGGLVGVVVEVHGGRDYVEAVEPPLRAAGAVVEDVARGLQIGERLALYARREAAAEAGPPAMPALLVGAVLTDVDHFAPTTDPRAASALFRVRIGPVTPVELAPAEPLRPGLEGAPSRSRRRPAARPSRPDPAPVVFLWDAAGLHVVAGVAELDAARATGGTVLAEIHALGDRWHQLAAIRYGGRCGLDAPTAVQAALARMNVSADAAVHARVGGIFLAEAVALLPVAPILVGRRRVRLFQTSVQGDGGIEAHLTELLVPGVGACYVREALRDQFEASGAERKGWKDGSAIPDGHQALHLAAPAWAWVAVAHAVRELDTRHRAVFSNRWWTLPVGREVFHGDYDPVERVRWLR